MTLCLALLLLAQSVPSDGVHLYQAGRFSEAAEAYRAEIKAHPDSAEAWAGEGRSLLKLGRLREASLYLAKALQLRPGDAFITRTLARCYLDAGDAAAVIALLERTDDKDPDVQRLLGEAMYRAGYYGRALQLLERTAKDRSGDQNAMAMYAVSLAKTGQTAEAERLCKRLLEPAVRPFNLDVLLTYAEILDDTSRSTEALRYADLAIEDQPANPVVHLWKARLLWHSGQTADAAREAERSVSLAPDLPFARNLLLQIYRKQGRIEDADHQADWLRQYNDRLASRGRE